MTRASLVIFISSLLASTAALATTYVRVEKDGTKTYSDRPLPGGQPVDIQPAQTYSAPPTPNLPDSTRPREEQALNEAANFRYQCALAPRHDETFHNPETVTLSVAVTPGLRTGDEVQFSVDGTALARGENPTSATLTLPERGTHTATVRIVDRYGKPVCDASTTFHVQRTSLNSPRRPRPTPH
ncbi:MAG TPA: DUF4124 domain-containing protein [Steroidobacteraceae bacterium]|nr:DUF4124 domain-containing protein [Steroidobacteraceae bacterium]